MLDPTTLVATYYGDMYFASHSAGSVLFYKDESRAYFVTTPTQFTASWYDAKTDRLYFIQDETGIVYEWDAEGGTADVMQWKSKVVSTKDFVNIGAVRLIADYTETTPVWDEATEAFNGAEYTWNLGYGLTFRLWVDGELEYEQEIVDKRVFRLPTGYKGDTFEFGFEGNVRVKAIHIGDTPSSLKEV